MPFTLNDFIIKLKLTNLTVLLLEISIGDCRLVQIKRINL